MLKKPMQLTKLLVMMKQLQLPGIMPKKMPLLPLLTLLTLKKSGLFLQIGSHSERLQSLTTGTPLNHGKKLGMTINAMPLKKQPRLTCKLFMMQLKML